MPAIAEQYKITFGNARPFMSDSAERAIDCATADISSEMGGGGTLWIGNKVSPFSKPEAVRTLEQIGQVCIRAYYDETPGESVIVERVEPEPEFPEETEPQAEEQQSAAPATSPEPINSPAPEQATEPAYAPYGSGAAYGGSRSGGNSGAVHRDRSDLAMQLRAETCGVRLKRTVFFNRRALDKKQVAKAADEFDALPDLLSASRKLLDQARAEYAAVLKIMREARKYWGASSVDYPIQGIRLIRKSLIAPFNERMEQFVADLNAALEKLELVYASMRDDAREKLGDLFDESDYPESLKEFFQISWDFPSVEPPNHLKELHPEIYEQQQKLVAARFEEAVRLQEEAFAEELRKLVAHLVERLTGTNDEGKPLTLNKAAVENVRDFFDRFQETAIHTSPELEELILHARKSLEGVDAAELRKNYTKRHDLAQDMERAKQVLDGLLVARPSRAISLDDE